MNAAPTSTWKTYGPFGLSTLLLLCYVLATLSPQSWWGLHHLAFLPVWIKATGFLLALFFWLVAVRCLLRPTQKPFTFPLPTFRRWSWLILPVACFGYFAFPMAENVYGDAQLFAERMGPSTETYEPIFLHKLLSPNIFSPKNGNYTVLSGVRLLSYGFGISHQLAFRWIGALCGVLFLFFWVRFIHQQLSSRLWKWLFLLIGATAPFTQFFYGYQEIYAPGFVAFLCWLIALTHFYQGPSFRRWLGLLFLWWLALKMHSAAFLFLPAMGWVTLQQFAPQHAWVKRLFTWKGIVVGALLPIVVGGAAVYFFVLGSYDDPRFLNYDVDIYERLFLPLLAPDPPLDRYTLLSGWHLWDIGQLMALWSVPAWFIAFWGVPLLFKKSYPDQRLGLVLALSLFLGLLLFFTVNPLMGMPIDADYFCLPGPILLVLAVWVVKSAGPLQLPSWKAPVLAGLCCLAIGVPVVNSHPKALGQRLESLSAHLFESYWIRSMANARTGVELQQLPPENQLERYLALATRLQPIAIAGNDHEMAILYQQMGKVSRQTLSDYNRAWQFHREAHRYDPELAANYIGLVETAFQLQRYDTAYTYSKALLRLQYPNAPKATRIALQCAVFAELRLEAQQLADAYLRLEKAPDVKAIRQELAKGAPMSSIQALYQP